MKDLEARKKLLVAESEVYRQTLRLDLQNLRLYGIRMQRRFATYAALRPLLMAAVPLAVSLFSRRDKERERRPASLLSRVMGGWRMFKSIQPLVASLLVQFAAGRAAAAAQRQATTPGKSTQTPESDPAAVI
jgi:hypothetical protein